MRAALTPLVLLLLTAGCLDGTDRRIEAGPSDPGSEQASTTGATPVDRVVEPGADLGSSTAPFLVVRLPFHKTADGAKSTWAGLEDEDAVLDVNLTGATAVLLELAWNSPVYDLDPNLIFLDECPEGGDLGEFTSCMPQESQDHMLSDGDDGNYWVKSGRLGEPDSPVRIVVGRDALASYGCDLGCTAMARAIVKELAVNVDGELVLTIVRGGELPDGYTALQS